MTRRRFIADTWTATSASLRGDQAVHLARVLRAEPGQIYDIVAGGFLHRAEIERVAEDEVRFALHEQLESEGALPLHLLLAVFKFDHFEWALEKATELGVARVTPLLARRTEKHLALAAGKRVERWRRIGLESAKQSRRVDVPAIDDPVALKAALEQVTGGTRILLSETEQAVSLTAALTGFAGPEVVLAIGPEGGWAAEEMALFTGQGWAPVTLGPRILRAETAAIAAIAIASSCMAPPLPPRLFSKILIRLGLDIKIMILNGLMATGPAEGRACFGLIFCFHFIKRTKTNRAFLNIYYLFWGDGVMGFEAGFGG